MKKYICAGLVASIAGMFFSMWLYAYQNVNMASADDTAINFSFSLGDIGPQLVANGTIDSAKLLANAYLTRQRGKLSITSDNAQDMLNLLWAFGLANKNEVLEKGPMMDPKYGGAGNFASTGGWTVAVGGAMEHYSHHEIVMLNPEQQERVNNVSKTVFRPCCRNSTYFPDCNHGMAMLGLLELMAANNMNEQKMKEYADQVNTKWFPQSRSSSCAV